MNISAIVLTKNEEKNIEECLKSLGFCSELIVIDDNSTDKTVKLSKQLGATVLTRNLKNDFSDQRNFGLGKAKNDWVLFVDADERIPDELKEEIIKSTEDSSINGFFIRRKDFMFGKELKFGETGNKRFLRLAKKDKGKWIGKVHEEWKVIGKLSTLNNPFLHYPHQTITEFLKEINFYTDLRAEELRDLKTNVSWYSIILYPKGKFWQNYFLKLGFLDGVPGVITALFMSFHSFLVRSKLWQLNNKETV